MMTLFFEHPLVNRLWKSLHTRYIGDIQLAIITKLNNVLAFCIEYGRIKLRPAFIKQVLIAVPINLAHSSTRFCIAMIHHMAKHGGIFFTLTGKNQVDIMLFMLKRSTRMAFMALSNSSQYLSSSLIQVVLISFILLFMLAIIKSSL